MTKATMEIDFLGQEDGDTSSMFRPATRGVHNSLPRLNTQPAGRGGATFAAPAGDTAEVFVAGPPPESSLLFFPPLPSPEQRQRFLAPKALRSPASKPSHYSMETWPNRSAAGSSTSPVAVAPLTIFYNGAITSFNLPREKAEAIMEWVGRTTSMSRPGETPVVAFPGGGGQQKPPPLIPSLGKLEGDLPLARKRSLQRFLEKRKER